MVHGAASDDPAHRRKWLETMLSDADEDADAGGNALSISAYSVGTAVDVSGNALADDTTISGFDNVDT